MNGTTENTVVVDLAAIVKVAQEGLRAIGPNNDSSDVTAQLAANLKFLQQVRANVLSILAQVDGNAQTADGGVPTK